jgi:polyisoprenoid-binding protein YceI
METTRDHAAVTPQLGRYEIDTSSSTVRFRTRHLFGLAPVRGTFTVRTGMADIAEPLAGSRIYAEIDAASFRTRSGQRDGNVRSPSFLDADRYPVMSFSSEHIDGQSLTGTLTVCGVSRPVRLAVEQPALAGESFTVRATTRIDRFDFGVTASRGLAGRYLDMTLEVRWVRR